MSILPRKLSEPPPTLMTSKAAGSAVHVALHGSRHSDHDGSASLDNYSLMSSTITDLESVGIVSGVSNDQALFNSLHFAQSKRSSDDLVAEAGDANETPSTTPITPPKRTTHEPTIKQENGEDDCNNEEHHGEPGLPTTPSPQRRGTRRGVLSHQRKGSANGADVPKFKIALSSHILNSPKTSVS